MAKKNKAIKEYLASIGAKGGKSTSPKKQAASRANGLKGGAPSNFSIPPKLHTLKKPCTFPNCRVTINHDHI